MMTRKFIVTPTAELDIYETNIWYDKQIFGLGKEFIEYINLAFDLIKMSPETYPVIFKKVRRKIVKKFPYIIYYLIDNETIVILAVLHAKRNPKEWKKRVN